MRLSLMLTAILTISMTAVVVLPLFDSSVNAITVNNTEFSINVLDNWAYRDLGNILGNILGAGPAVRLIPNEFTQLLVNPNQELSGKSINNQGAYSTIDLDTDYPFRNVPLSTYTQYNLNVSEVKVFSKENATIDGEQAIRIHRTPRDNSSNVQVVDYYIIHDGKPYTLQFAANMKDFQRYLPQFEQIVKTFRFVK